jgi:formylglycine-generating enzyme required for sulfatase activity
VDQTRTNSESDKLADRAQLDARIAEGYPEWLALPYGEYATAYDRLGSDASSAECHSLLLKQCSWIQLWLRYLLVVQASGRWLARQPLEEFSGFPACCQPGSSLYLLWQATEQICRLEQKGPLPFRQMHQWLGKHQTGWGMLLNQLLELSSESDAQILLEGLRYNDERLIELLKSADFMIDHEVYGVLPEPAEAGLGVRYRGTAVKGIISGGLPEPGSLFLEDPRTGTRFQLPFLRLCPQCQASDRFMPLIWQTRSLDQGLRFVGCEHAPVYYADSDATGMGAASAYVRFANQNWHHGSPEPDLAFNDSGPTWPNHLPSPQLACVVYSELLLDALLTLKDPQQLLAAYERIVLDLLDWSGLDEEKPEDICAQLSGQDATLLFSASPEQGLAFALALHQLVHDYNRHQSVPSAHLQVRTGLALGLVQGGAGRGLKGGPLSEARQLASLGCEGQILASEAVRERFTSLSPAHERLFQRVGTRAEAGEVYTLYTRTAGDRSLPGGLLDPPGIELLPSETETITLLEGQPDLPALQGFQPDDIKPDESEASDSEAPAPEAPAGERDIKSLFARRPRTIQNHLGMIFRLIYPGRFMMGSPEGEAGRLEDEAMHLVVLEKAFYLMTTPVTQKQWEQVMGENPSFFKHPDRPVETISWYQAQIFVTRLNARGPEVYRLPTEAEWEYCCRAGSSSLYGFGGLSKNLSDYAWYGDNSAEGQPFKQSHPVATRLPNRWGLYDMHGNVWEWVNDWYSYLGLEMAKDPLGPADGEERVIKGGRWNSQAPNCRSASRSYLPPDEVQAGSLGFRLLLEAD